jgi:3-hydroxyacyl-CoA dehydrogenase/enoyl-CoA hydratase/3-hydroxybutyryl-CoA epimerase
MIEVCLTARELRRDRGLEQGVEPRSVESAVVIGGGRIGAGVAALTVTAGIAVRLKEQDDERAGRALTRVRELVDERASAGQASALNRDRVFARLSVATDYSGLRNADIVIEAVPENVALKHAILRDLERLVEPTCVIASTTSSIPIAQIAQAAGSPERVLGMHYFHPASKVDLLEIVRADKTEPWAVAAAAALGKKQGKTVIVVKDSPGFYTTRVLAPLLAEAALLVGEGVAIEAVDDALVDWGIPVGPLQLLDDVGLDVGAQVAQVLHAAFAERMTPPAAIAKLVAEGRQGRATGRGFYRYEARGGVRTPRRAPDPGVYALLGVMPTARLPVEEIQMRCALALVNEVVRCFGEGVVRSPRDADIGAILGLGFPRFRGGPLRYVDTIGSAETLRRVQGYADRFGERWRPAPLLVQMARRGERFYP